MITDVVFIKEPSHVWDLDDYPTSFETAVTDGTKTILRIRVPGGFIAIFRDSSDSSSRAEFISEPGFRWEIS